MKHIFLVCLIFSFCLCPVFAVDKYIWTQADSLMKRKDFRAAFKLSESIIEKDPEDVFGWQLRLNSFSQLADTKGKWPKECVSSALKYAEIHKPEEVPSLTTAIWCLNHENQYSIGSIVPQLSEDQLKTIKAADGVIIVWAGTRQPDGVLITNGGGTEWNYGTETDPEVRLTILSDSNKKNASGNHANHPIFIYHELFHVLEWAYHQSKFPKDNHPYQRRKVWPYDYQGETEWDFYSETFQKRMKKEYNLDRVYWQGRKEGFYGILVKEQGKSK